MRDNHPELSDEDKEIQSKVIIIVPDPDTNEWCATRGDHISLSESPYGKGLTAEMALQALFKAEEAAGV